MKRKNIITVGVVLTFLVLFIGMTYLNSVMEYQSKVRDMTITEIDLSQVPDGVYEGECDVNFIAASVRVVVKDGAITEINLLEYHNERGAAAEVITRRVVEEQRLDVDTVSGATNSSRVIKKAIEEAIKNGIRK